MDISASRQRPEEQARIADLLSLIPPGARVLDIGARDGYISRLLTKSFDEVTALDLEKPDFPDDDIITVAGDVTNLQFEDNSFDAVVCAEVLEHIPPHLLQKACSELARVSRSAVVIGVPFRQDTRIGRTTCRSCGKHNPPWGHVNRFDEARLESLFSSLRPDKTSLVGENDSHTNFVSCFLQDLARNPYGTYDQEESCIHCGSKLIAPEGRNLAQRVLVKAAFLLMRAQKPFTSPHANWIQMRFVKEQGADGPSGVPAATSTTGLATP